MRFHVLLDGVAPRPRDCSFVVVFLLAWLTGPSARAEIVFDQLGVAFTEDFDDFDGSGMQPGGGSGTLDSNVWDISFFDNTSLTSSGIGAVHGSGLFGRGTSSGGAAETGVYAYLTGGGNVALGLLNDTSGFRGSFPAIQVTNNTGFEVDVIEVSYDMYVFNDTDTEYYADLEFTKGLLYTDPVFFETAGTADTSPGWVRTPIEFQLFLPTASTNDFPNPLTPLANGESIEIGWSIGDLAGSGLSDGIAIDNLSITLQSTAIPEPNSALALSVATLLVLVRRTRRRLA